MFQRATLAEKEVTTLKEQLATTSPTPLQATVPKTNGSHIEPTRDQATETRIDRFSPDIKEEKQDVDDDVEQKMEMAATGRSNSNSSRSSPVVHQPGNLEVELAAKEKEVSFQSVHCITRQVYDTTVSVNVSINCNEITSHSYVVHTYITCPTNVHESLHISLPLSTIIGACGRPSTSYDNTSD